MRLLAMVLLSTWAAFATAARFEIIVTGKLKNGADTSTSGRSVFGVAGSLTGAPFKLVCTIDDRKGRRRALAGTAGESLGTEIESLDGDLPVTAMLTIGARTVSFGGSFPTRTSYAVRKSSHARDRSLVEFRVEERPPSTVTLWAGGGAGRVQLSFRTAVGAPLADDGPDWSLPFDHEVTAGDACSACNFYYRRYPTHQSTDREQAEGNFAIERIALREVIPQ